MPIGNWFDQTQWELLFSTDDLNDYYGRLGTLKNEGIEVKTKTLSSGSAHGGGASIACIYQVFVRKPILHQASEALEM
ncbi:hypothetical protein [Halobacillus salinus]|uniref:DUF2007 domain-containing protein n=1 Tax=Halobacillus salinus TaxID=192814 RepID=A0A4Z0H5C7_9BACI|nr:hypothetical protein [Halobacillus salinus]TGB04446.1 hypothetical protein E4663_05470 [Halobacillus salinus]